MTLNEMKIIISRNDNIPKDSYSLDGGLPNEALCIFRHGEEWDVTTVKEAKRPIW